MNSAADLQKAGAGPEMTVGLLAERSPEAVAAILGILQAGAAYLPLDPGQPDERLEAIVADARPVVVLAQPEHAHRMSAPVEVLDATPPAKAMRAKPANVAADNLAYVIYTSGSTGIPKAVVVTHHNVVRLVKNPDYVDLTADDVFLHLAPLSFDASTFEIWGALLNGARLVVYPDGIWYGRLTPERLTRILHEHVANGRPVREWIAAEMPSLVRP